MTLIMSNRHLHHATNPELLRVRIDRLAALANDQIEAGLTWLGRPSSRTIDAGGNAARVWDDGQAVGPVAAFAGS
jgi:hypothetical protein